VVSGWQSRAWLWRVQELLGAGVLRRDCVLSLPAVGVACGFAGCGHWGTWGDEWGEYVSVRLRTVCDMTSAIKSVLYTYHTETNTKF
jgi:hypothetical protein